MISQVSKSRKRTDQDPKEFTILNLKSDHTNKKTIIQGRIKEHQIQEASIRRLKRKECCECQAVFNGKLQHASVFIKTHQWTPLPEFLIRRTEMGPPNVHFSQLTT